MKMSKRTTIILVSFWSLVLLPALCDGGALAHACGCETPACDFECGCGPDPCEQVASSNDNAKPQFDSVTAAQPSVPTPTLTDADAASPLIRALLHLPSRHSLRCFGSDLPLLN